MNPDPFTLRELLWMDTGHDKQLWNHTAQIICWLYSINRGEEDPQLEPADFNPYYAQDKKEVKVVTSDLSFLKQFCKPPDRDNP